MALPTGRISKSQVNIELAFSTSARISLGNAGPRQLAGKPAVGSRISMSDLRGKSADSISPTMNITVSPATVTIGNTATFTFTASEPIFGFTASDVVIAGGLSNLSGSGTTYTSVWTPPVDGLGSGAFNVPAGTYTDAAGNPGQVSNTAIVYWDTRVYPTVNVTASATSVGVGQTAVVYFSFSEPVNFGIGNITGSEFGTLSGFGMSGDGLLAYVTFTPNPNTYGQATISAQPNSFTDIAGNFNQFGSLVNITVNTVVADTTVPTATMTATPPYLTSGQTSTIEVTFSEPVTIASGPTLTGGGVHSFVSGSGNYRSFTFVPPDQVNGSTFISYPAGSFYDAAGNYNTTNYGLTVTYNTVTASPFYLQSGDGLSVGEPTGTQFTNTQYIDVFPYGGVAPYTYSWSKVNGTATITGGTTAQSLAVQHVITKFGYTGISTFNAVVNDSIGNVANINVTAEWRWETVPV